MATRVAILGATGRMGRLVRDQVDLRSDMVLAAQVAQRPADGVGTIGPGCFADAQVVIDFSLPEGLRSALPHLGSAALVSGTTGLDEALRSALAEQAAVAPVLVAANFSVGIHVLRDLVAKAAATLPDADIELVETHHRHKVDSPSGTALLLAEAAANARGVHLADVTVAGRAGACGPRTRAEIGIHAVRGGDVAGEHVVHLLLDGERVGLSHVASGRGTFARGAVRAAGWIAGRPPGAYTLSDVLSA